MRRGREDHEHDVLRQHLHVVGEELAPQGIYFLAGLIIDILLEEKLAQSEQQSKSIDCEVRGDGAEDDAA